MAKSNLEKQLEKMQKDAKKQAQEEKRMAIKKEIIERASSIVNGQPVINGLRIMDETSELVLESLLVIYKKNDNYQIKFSFEDLPKCVENAVPLELEKLTQYGMISGVNLLLGWGFLNILPPALTYFEKKNGAKTIGSSNEEDSIVKFDNKKVFIVHGHDDLAKIEMARTLEKAGFEAIILHEQPDSGKTIIEKIETFSNVAFAVVLYTECDLGRDKNVSVENEKYRARQNVVFEHGYLIGKLGRSNVEAFVKGEVETPGDISGVVYTPLDSNGAWKMRLARNMKAAGLDVDFNKWID